MCFILNSVVTSSDDNICRLCQRIDNTGSHYRGRSRGRPRVSGSHSYITSKNQFGSRKCSPELTITETHVRFLRRVLQLLALLFTVFINSKALFICKFNKRNIVA